VKTIPRAFGRRREFLAVLWLGAVLSSVLASACCHSNKTHPNTTDVDTIIGKAKFYEGTLPADFIRPNEKTSAGDRRSTTTQPPFWDGTGTDHNLSVSWDCTAGNDIRTLLPTPPLTDECTDRSK